MCLLGLLGLPYFVWRRPPVYYWRCPACGHRNGLASARCQHCDHIVLRDHMHQCIRGDWRGRDLIALYLSAQVISLATGSLLILALGRMPSDEATVSDLVALANDPEIVWLLVLLMGGTLAVLTAWMLSARYRWPISEIGLHAGDATRNVLLGVGVGLAAFVVQLGARFAGAYVPFLAEEQGRLLSLFPVQATDPLWMLILASIVVVGPVSNELFFRGMVYRLSRARWPARTAIPLTALLFAIGGDPMSDFIPLLALGIGNGILVERTRSLVPSIVSASIVGLLTAASVVIRSAAMAG